MTDPQVPTKEMSLLKIQDIPPPDYRLPAYTSPPVYTPATANAPPPAYTPPPSYGIPFNASCDYLSSSYRPVRHLQPRSNVDPPRGPYWLQIQRRQQEEEAIARLRRQQDEEAIARLLRPKRPPTAEEIARQIEAENEEAKQRDELNRIKAERNREAERRGRMEKDIRAMLTFSMSDEVRPVFNYFGIYCDADLNRYEDRHGVGATSVLFAMGLNGCCCKAPRDEPRRTHRIKAEVFRYEGRMRDPFLREEVMYTERWTTIKMYLWCPTCKMKGQLDGASRNTETLVEGVLAPMLECSTETNKCPVEVDIKASDRHVSMEEMTDVVTQMKTALNKHSSKLTTAAFSAKLFIEKQSDFVNVE